MPPPETDLSALLRAVVELQTAISHMRTEQAEIKRWLSDIQENLTYEINGNIFTKKMKVKKEQEQPMTTTSLGLPESLLAIPGMEIIEVNAPQLYIKVPCQVCLREWIIPISLGRLDKFQPPNRCRWCDSTVWNNPEKAQARSDQRSKRDSLTTQSQSLSQ